MSDFELVSDDDDVASVVTVTRGAEVPLYGNLRPFCRGRLLWSPQASHWIVALLTLAASMVLFVLLWGTIRLTAPSLLHSTLMTQAPDIVVVLLGLVCIVFLLCTSLLNPGILPKSSSSPSFSSNNPGLEYCTTLPFCMTCHIYSPSLAGHCRRCNNCVAHFDHHCRLLGCCIGQLNKRYFLLLLSGITVYNVFISVCCVYFLVVVSSRDSLLRYVACALLLPVSLLLSMIFAGYLAHNLRLIRMGLLHREFMKGMTSRTRSRGSFIANLLLVCFPRRDSND